MGNHSDTNHFCLNCTWQFFQRLAIWLSHFIKSFEMWIALDPTSFWPVRKPRNVLVSDVLTIESNVMMGSFLVSSLKFWTQSQILNHEAPVPGTLEILGPSWINLKRTSLPQKVEGPCEWQGEKKLQLRHARLCSSPHSFLADRRNKSHWSSIH